MAGNTFGTLFRVTSFGESHGPALGAIVDGCPAGIELSEADLQIDLDRRKPGQSKFTTQRKEADEVKILSGVFEGKTTGMPIGLLIHNTDQKSKDYTSIKDLFRPGHADFTYHHKFDGHRDYRGSGRASARETAMRVAAGAIAKKVLKAQCNVDVRAYVSQIGDITCGFKSWSEVSQNPFFVADSSCVESLESLIHDIRKQGDSIGAKVTCVAENMPVGLGEPVFDRLDAEVAKAMMSINAVRGVEMGDGFACVAQKGSEHRDEMDKSGFLSNHAGGTLGGISTGQDLITHIALKPTSSITTPGKTVDTSGNETTVVTKGRHDPCVGIRAVPICEAMMALTLVDMLFRRRAHND